MRWRRGQAPHGEAERARVRAEVDLAIRRAEASRLHELTQEWRRIRERNHLAAAIRASFERRHA